MSIEIRIKPEDLPKILKSHEKRLPKAIHEGLVRTAHRSRTMLAQLSPVDTGQFKNSWQVKDGIQGVTQPTVVNDAPHAGIIENGARPHGVNKEGIEALTRWAMRKITGGDEKAARSIAFAIAAKLKKVGQKGHFIIRDNMDRMRNIAVREVVAAIASELEKR